MQIYLVLKAGLMVSCKRQHLECYVFGDENIWKACPGARQLVADHSIWQKFKEEKRFLLKCMFPNFKVNGGENEWAE